MAPSQHGRADAHFDATAIAAAQLAPTLQIGRLTYRGRLLSIVEWLPWWEEGQALDRQLADAKNAAPVDPAAVLRVLHARSDFARRYLRVIFPRRRFPFYAPDPVEIVMAKSYQFVEETLKFFFILQARATFGAEAIDKMRPPVPPELQTISGTNSPGRTAAASVAGEA